MGENGFHRISLSEPIKKEYSRRHDGSEPWKDAVPETRDWRQSLQDIGDEKRLERLDYWVARAVKDAPDGKNLVIDGIRNLGEIQALRGTFPVCYVIAVVASKDTRWKRVQDLYDRDLKAFERDEQRDADGDIINGQQVEKCVNDADYVLWNEQDLRPAGERGSTLLGKLSRDVALMRGNGAPAGYPTPAESYMTSAYAASHLSRCLKRFVGAVIVSDKGIPLSLGFNENPIIMKSCESEYGHCFKDTNMGARLEEMGKVYCPDCGEKQDALAPPWRCKNTNCRTNLKLRFFPNRNMELCTAIHAEERAIRSLGDRDATGATLYVTTFPCLQCARHIVDVGISNVVYVEAYPVAESQKFLEHNRVVVKPFEGFKARAFTRIFKQRD